MPYKEAFYYGIAGAVLAEFIYWAKFQKTFHKKKPAHVNSKFYWFCAIVWILVGGFLPWIYLKMDVNINFLFCIHVGGTAPIILSQVIKGKLDVG